MPPEYHSCPACSSSNLVVGSELFTECIQVPNKPERCIAIIVPVATCVVCGSKWLTEEAEVLRDTAFMDALG